MIAGDYMVVSQPCHKSTSAHNNFNLRRLAVDFVDLLSLGLQKKAIGKVVRLRLSNRLWGQRTAPL